MGEIMNGVKLAVKINTAGCFHAHVRRETKDVLDAKAKKKSFRVFPVRVLASSPSRWVEPLFKEKISAISIVFESSSLPFCSALFARSPEVKPSRGRTMGA